MNNLAIIIPGYNCEQFVKKCLDSIIMQEYSDFIVFFIDDGSTDNTAEIVKSYDDERISYHWQENFGVSSARNRGIMLAENYKYIVFVDADDWMEPKYLESLLSDTNADFVFCDWNEYKRKGDSMEIVSTKVNKDFSEETQTEDVINHFLRSRSGGSPWGKLFKNEIIRKHGIRFIEGLPYAEDYLFNLTYLKYASSIFYIPVPLYAYNCMQNGARSRFRRNRVDVTIQIENVKFDLYSSGGEIAQDLMISELIEQMAVARVNLNNKNFSKEERKAEIDKILIYMREKEIGLKTIFKSKAGYKAKIICLFLCFCHGGKIKNEYRK